MVTNLYIYAKRTARYECSIYKVKVCKLLQVLC
ncbi:hypothetical protein CLMAG_21420 [Clostridium magnum DSM 2767]|uniref:Uncharacterized protein n=1 Tax=Clostridium magnum DSM 2767 TaxID=1121326 RepID=A0A162T7Q9_9CLOT|nr:hypothetical protein CLMAG_21420 [Clostridium magnum DSM 2767]